MKTHTLMCLLAMMPLLAMSQEPPPDMPLPPMKKDERVVKAQQETKAERQKREAAEADARKAKAENDELKRQLTEAKKQAAPAEAAKVSRGDAMPVGANAGTTNYAPLSIFRDKLSDATLGPEMVVIPAGEFDMGDNESNEKQVRKARIGKPFALGKTEVTQALWRRVMGGDPPKLTYKGCDDCPVEGVNWYDTQDFIERLNVLTGKKFRLPSEAEWEYAAKAGGSYKYAGSDDISEVAWYRENSGYHTYPAGQKKANAWGLYDMTGNVWELVEDCRIEGYPGYQPTRDDERKSRDCRGRIERGGSYGNSPSEARSSYSFSTGARDRNAGTGFRLARTLP